MIEPVYNDGRVRLYHGDSLDVLKTLPANSVDSLVTDPPAGVSFMGKGWDDDKGGRKQWIAWLAAILTEAFRVLKPGAHAIVWSLPRTSHWTATALEDAGFEIRDCIMHVFGSGFPKSHNVSKAIDKSKGAVRKKVGERMLTGNAAIDTKDKGGTYAVQVGSAPAKTIDVTEPATPEAKQWDGWGTALKPAQEAWWLCRKPLSGTTVENVLKYGTGAINVDGCRVETDDDLNGGAYSGDARERAERTANDSAPGAVALSRLNRGVGEYEQPAGRWPPNLILSHSVNCNDDACEIDCPVALMDRQSGTLKSGDSPGFLGDKSSSVAMGTKRAMINLTAVYADSGGASRFFPIFTPDTEPFLYSAKPSSAEKNDGLEHMDADKTIDDGREKAIENPYQRGMTKRKLTHPTVKGQHLMRWLVRLVTPPGGTVLDCFAGSGSTLMAARSEDMRAIGIELSDEYVEFIRARVAHVAKNPNLFEKVDVPLVDERAYMKPPAQSDMFGSNFCTVQLTKRKQCGKPAVSTWMGLSLCSEHTSEVRE